MNAKDNASQIIVLADEIVHCAEDIGKKADTSEIKSDKSESFMRNRSQSHMLVDRNDLISHSKKLYLNRRRRELIFKNTEIFSEPAWDIMLDLFASHLQGQNISISSACLAAHVPTTTAWRWLVILEKAGLLERVKDPADGRRSFVQLTDDAIAKVIRVLDESP
jgi:hypothetical protein